MPARIQPPPRIRLEPCAAPWKTQAWPGATPSSGMSSRTSAQPGAPPVTRPGTGGRVERTFTVMPGTVSPPPGRYTVTSRSAKVMGSDGVPVEHVVIFAHVNGVYVGFSAAVDGSTPTPDPARKTGGVREARADGAAMWSFAEPGAPVVVTP